MLHIFREHITRSAILLPQRRKNREASRGKTQKDCYKAGFWLLSRNQNCAQGEFIMRANLHRHSLGGYAQPAFFDGYEQRLTRWGCAECNCFEKRVFSSGVRSEELDAYIICRFAGEPIDLIREASACPKDRCRELDISTSKSGPRRLHCVHKA
jgi:hypothetical protein